MKPQINKSFLFKIKKHLKRFKKIKNKEKIFQELCFCILVANNNLERTLKVWRKVKDKLSTISQKELKRLLKNLGYRFYNKRAEYIVYNKKFYDTLPEKIKTLKGNELREWLVKNLKGIGYKEASHFLRNLGFKNFAIIDRHVLNFLLKNKLIKAKPKSLNEKKYLEMENILEKLAKRLNLNLAELDAFIFYKETSKLPKK